MRSQVRLLCPSKPGVYGMIDRDGELIYVGKAKNLRVRLLSYFRPRSRGRKAARHRWPDGDAGVGTVPERVRGFVTRAGTDPTLAAALECGRATVAAAKSLCLSGPQTRSLRFLDAPASRRRTGDFRPHPRRKARGKRRLPA